MSNQYELERSVAELAELKPMQILLGDLDEQIVSVEEELRSLHNVRDQMTKGLTGEQILMQTTYLQGKLEGLHYIKSRLTYYKKHSKQLQHE